MKKTIEPYEAKDVIKDFYYKQEKAEERRLKKLERLGVRNGRDKIQNSSK